MPATSASPPAREDVAVTSSTPTAPAGRGFAFARTSPVESPFGAAALAVAAIAGHLCTLQLIDAPRYAVYQHYRPWDWITSGQSMAFLGVIAQAVIVGLVGWRIRDPLWRTARGILTARGWIVATAVLGVSIAVPAHSLSFFLGEIALGGAVMALAVLNLLLAALLAPQRTIVRLAAWVDARVTLRPEAASPRRWDRFLPAAIAVWIAIVAAAANIVVFERMPHIDDSVSNLFQAKYFADGRLFLPAPPDATSFQGDQTVVDASRWYGYAFPGWPALLALGVLVGVPWLVNPLLGGATILLGHAFLRHRLDRATANATVLLLGLSPWLIFMSAEFMPHPLTGVLALGALLAFDRAAPRHPSWVRWALLAGAAIGALVLTRAIEAALVGGAVAVSGVLQHGGVRRLIAPLALTLAVAAAAAAVMPAYNLAVTGRADYPPHLAWSDSRWGPGVDRLGFGPDIGIRAWPNLDPLPGHGARDVVLNANKNLFMVNADLFGWPTGSLLCVAVALGIGRWRRGDALLLVVSAAYIIGHSLYWFSGGPDIGARYWYPLVVPLAALTARGAQMAVERLRDTGAWNTSGARIGILIGLASLVAAVTTIPWRAATKYHEYRGVTSEVRDLAGTHGFGHALVFIRSGDRADYQSAFSLNPASLDHAGTVYAWDAGTDARARVVAAFPDRPIWVIERRPPGPDGEGPFVLLEGPLPAGTVPR